MRHAKKVKSIAKGLIKAQEADKENYSPIIPKLIKNKNKTTPEMKNSSIFGAELVITPFS